MAFELGRTLREAPQGHLDGRNIARTGPLLTAALLEAPLGHQRVAPGRDHGRSFERNPCEHDRPNTTDTFNRLRENQANV